MKTAFHSLLLSETDTLVAVEREWHTRKSGCYLVSDRYGKFLLVSQRLPLVADFVNAMAHDKSERVSVPALHQIVGLTENRVCGYSKGRWRVEFCPLEHVGSQIARARAGFERAVILGAPSAYRIAAA